MTNQAQTRSSTIAAIRAELKARGLVPVHRRSVPLGVLQRQLALLRQGVAAVDPIALDSRLATPGRRTTLPPPAKAPSSPPPAPPSPTEENLLDALADRMLEKLIERLTKARAH